MSILSTHPDANGPVGLAMLAYLLRLPVSWLRAEAVAGRIPCLRVGKRFLFDVPAVRRALSARAAVAREVAHA